jgi:ferritin-like metal-binding protein YciE
LVHDLIDTNVLRGNTMSLDTLPELLHDQLKDLQSAESQLIKALPKMAKAASSAALRTAIEHHLEETQTQLERLLEIGAALDVKLGGKKCKGMEGLIKEGSEPLKEDAEGAVLDLAIIAGAQRIEHYEIAAYGTAREVASQLGLEQVVALLQQTLDEEGAANEKLTAIALELYDAAPAEAARP